MWAAKNGRSQCARALVAAGADTVVKDSVRYYARVNGRYFESAHEGVRSFAQTRAHLNISLRFLHFLQYRV